MSEIKWVLLTDNYGRSEADIIKSYLGAQDIKVEFFLANIPQMPYSTNSVEIFVPDFQLERAQELLRATGWKIDPDDE